MAQNGGSNTQLNILNNNQNNRPQQYYRENGSFPVIDICFTSRSQGSGITSNRQPLLKYKKQIRSYQAQFHNQKLPDYNHFQPLSKKDGLIHIFRQMYIQKKHKYTDSNQFQHFYGPKILIVVCMYNQGINAINLTLNGIYNNLRSLKEQGISPEQIAVVLVQDGILKLVQNRNRRTYVKRDLSIVEFIKKLDEAQGKEYCDLEVRLNTILDSIDDFKRKEQNNLVMENSDFPPNIQKNVAMLYQNQWWPSLTEKDQHKKRQLQRMHLDTNGKPYFKLKLFSCFKHLNGKKLSSHLWFFQGFCRYLQPQFVVLLDVGTKPGSEQDNGDYNGLTNLIKGFYIDKDVGGVTGLMSIDSQFPSLEGDGERQDQNGCIQDYFYSIEKAQEYQYIMAHFLDKNFQSATGFLHVLPGAWSAYRYIALIKSQKYEENLLQKSYFTPILNPDMQQNGSCQQQNMYLAQDRILSIGIYCQQKSRYILQYIPDAVAYTDPMKDHKNLLAQRRRWINSSLFAFLYVWKNYYFNVLQSDHNAYRSYIAINFSMIFAGLSFINSYFSPALYFFVLYITIAQIDSSNTIFADIATIVSGIYCLIILGAVGGSLLGKQWQKQAHIISVILSFFTFAMFGLLIYNIVAIYLDFNNLGFDNFRQGSVLIMLGINIGSFVLIVLMHLFTHFKFVVRLISDTFSYMSYVGAYSQTMVIYGMCNVDDVSWGTKGATGSGGVSKFFTKKVYFVSSWLFYNCSLAYILLYVDIVVPQRENKQGGIVLIGIGIYSSFILFFKTLLALCNFIHWVFKCKILKVKVDVDQGSANRISQFYQRQKRDYFNQNNINI